MKQIIKTVINAITWWGLTIMFFVNVARVLVLDKTPYIPWGYLGLWLLCNIILFVILLRTMFDD